MRAKLILLAVAFMMGVGVSQVLAESASELAKNAANKAELAASQTAAFAAEGHSKTQALAKAVADLQATIKTLEAGPDKVALEKARKELKKLTVLLNRAVVFVRQLDRAAAEAKAAALVARAAANRASAEGVTEAEARAAAGQAIRQAKKADMARDSAGKNMDYLSQWVAGGGGDGGPQVPPKVTTPTTVTTTTTTTTTTSSSTTTTSIPRPGPTPTEVGRGRRGTL